jgi:branched-chain amino acid transport system substrate-binding protein
MIGTRALVALLAVLSFTAAAGAQTKPEVIHIPVILSLTGTAAFIAKGEADDLRLVEELVNKRGGVNGRPIKFDIQDDESNTQTALQLTNAILAQKPPFMMGPTLAQDCNAVAPLFKDARPVEFCFSAAVAVTPGGNVFASGIGPRDLVGVQLRYLRERGFKRVAVLSSTDATGQAFDTMLTAALALPENKDVTVVAYEHFGLGDVSIAAQIARIKTQAPQALMTFTVGPAFGTELRAISDAGLDVPVSASSGDMIATQLAQYKAFLPKELYFAASPAAGLNDVGNPRIKEAQAEFTAAFKAAGIRTEFPTTLAWDPALIMVDAYRKLGPTPTGAQVRAYLDTLHDWVGINGTYDFRNGDRRGIGEKLTLIYRWDTSRDDVTAVSGLRGIPK